jgi:hypothetical protein
METVAVLAYRKFLMVSADNGSAVMYMSPYNGRVIRSIVSVLTRLVKRRRAMSALGY